MANTNIITLTPAKFMAANFEGDASGDGLKVNRAYMCDFSELYDKIVYIGFFDCKKAETAARRMSKLIGIDITTLEIEGRYNGDVSRYSIDENSRGFYVYVTIMTDWVNYIDDDETETDETETETAANDDTETETTNGDDTDGDAVTPFARLRKLCGASLKYDATKSGDAAKPVYTFTAANGDGGIITRYDDYYEINVNDNVIELYDDGGRVVRVAENNDDARTIYRRALDMTTNDTAANYDDDARRTIKLDTRKSTPKKRVYRVNSTAAKNAAAVATKNGAFDDAPKTKRAPRTMPAVIMTAANGEIFAKTIDLSIWQNGGICAFINTICTGDNDFYTVFIPSPRNEFIFETMRIFPHIPFIEISGDTVTKRGKTVKRTYHIIDNTTPYGDIMNALLCARVSIRLKRDRMAANGGNTIVVKLEKRENALARVYREMCANYSIFGNMQIYDDNAKIYVVNYIDTDETADAPKKTETAAALSYDENGDVCTVKNGDIFKKATETTPKSAAAYITAKLTYLAETDDGETYEILMTALQEIYCGLRAPIELKPYKMYLDAVKSIYAPRKISAVYVPQYEISCAISPQTRYNELSAINDYLSAETKTIKIDTYDANGDAARDKNGERIKQTIYINRLDDETTNGDDTDDGDDGKNTKFSIMDIAALEKYRRENFAETETAMDIDDTAAAVFCYDLWLDSFDDETQNFIAEYGEICGGANRRGGNGGANGLRTVAKKCGISYKRARTIEKRVKQSFNDVFKLKNAHISKYPLVNAMHNKLDGITENDAKTNGKYIAYNNAPAVKFAPIKMIDFSDDINDALYMYIARKYAIMRTYREMMTNFKRA